MPSRAAPAMRGTEANTARRIGSRDSSSRAILRHAATESKPTDAHRNVCPAGKTGMLPEGGSGAYSRVRMQCGSFQPRCGAPS